MPSPPSTYSSGQHLQKTNQHQLAPGSDGIYITRLGIKTKLVPKISRGGNLRAKMDFLTNQKAVERRLGYMELHEPHSPIKT